MRFFRFLFEGSLGEGVDPVDERVRRHVVVVFSARALLTGGVVVVVVVVSKLHTTLSSVSQNTHKTKRVPTSNCVIFQSHPKIRIYSNVYE